VSDREAFLSLARVRSEMELCAKGETRGNVSHERARLKGGQISDDLARDGTARGEHSAETAGLSRRCAFRGSANSLRMINIT